MLLRSWVTWAVRSRCLSFKCSQPDSSFPYCVMVVKVFKDQSLLFYAFEGSYKSEHLLALEESTGKKVLPFKLFLTALNPNSHLFGSSVPGCSSDCPQQGPCRQVFLLSVTPAAPLEGQRPVPSNATSRRPSVGISPGAVLAEA